MRRQTTDKKVITIPHPEHSSGELIIPVTAAPFAISALKLTVIFFPYFFTANRT